MLKFNDGMNFDTSGEPRVTRRRDGYYVIGNGMLIPCMDRAEAEEIVAEMKSGKKAEPVTIKGYND